jgi:hypothetical protein
MANPEHLSILKQGVKIWNEWRKINHDVIPDLCGICLDGIDLWEANLSYAKLCRTYGHSFYAIRANFSEADLSNVSFHNCRLNGSNFEKANLIDAGLYSCDCLFASFRYADLQKAQLCASNLQSDFYGADLSKTDLRGSHLMLANLQKANITGAFLWASARDSWGIKDIICNYIYFDSHARQRCPKDRDFALGEFEQLYASLPTFEYVFENGMAPIDPLIMDRVVQAVRNKIPEFDIKIDSINARGLAPSIKFTVQREEQKETALQAIQKEYEVKRAQLEGKIEVLQDIVRELINKPSKINNIIAPQAQYLAIDGSILNVQQTGNYYALELQKAIKESPKESFIKISKDKALDIVGGVLEDIAKDGVKEAAKKIAKLGVMLSPIVIDKIPHVFEFFKNILGQ